MVFLEWIRFQADYIIKTQRGYEKQRLDYADSGKGGVIYFFNSLR
jgi:hypothetical protein